MIVDSLVIKVASRCNLNCSYCYVYNLGDTTYLKQPKFMSSQTVDIMIDRVIEHCLENNIKSFLFIFHGGEPLLQKKDFFRYTVNKANQMLFEKYQIECSFTLQTNGVLITKEWCELFDELNIGIGISLDGTEKINDEYRVDHKGNGSYNKVIKGLKIAQKNLKYNPGILSVVNIDADPLETYEHIKSINVNSFSLLWPHATHDVLPQKKSSIEGVSEETPYADWSIKIFDLWYSEKKQTKIEVTLFNTFLSLLLGNEFSGNEDFGLGDNDVLVIETNGDIQAVGSLNICGNGFTTSGANVRTHSFSEALETKLAKLYHQSHKMLPKKCISCPIVDICGGGHIHTRYSKKNGFNNASIYCNDFIKLITHVRREMYTSLPDKYKKDYSDITFNDIKMYMSQLNMDEIKTPQHEKELDSF